MTNFERLGRLAGLALGGGQAGDLASGAAALRQAIVLGCQQGALILRTALTVAQGSVAARGLGLPTGKQNDPVVVESSRIQQRRERTLLDQVFPGKGWGGALSAFGQGRYLASLLGAGPGGREMAGIGAGLGFLLAGPVGALAGGLLGGLFGKKKRRSEDEQIRRALWNTPEGYEIQAYLYNATQALKQWGLPSFVPVPQMMQPRGMSAQGAHLRVRDAGFGGAPADFSRIPVTQYVRSVGGMFSGRRAAMSGPSVTVQRMEVNIRADSERAGKEAARQLWREFHQFAELDAPLTGLVEL